MWNFCQSSCWVFPLTLADASVQATLCSWALPPKKQIIFDQATRFSQLCWFESNFPILRNPRFHHISPKLQRPVMVRPTLTDLHTKHRKQCRVENSKVDGNPHCKVMQLKKLLVDETTPDRWLTNHVLSNLHTDGQATGQSVPKNWR